MKVCSREQRPFPTSSAGREAGLSPGSARRWPWEEEGCQGGGQRPGGQVLAQPASREGHGAAWAESKQTRDVTL